MARGKSGRIVLEVDPEEKDDIYEALEQDGMTLKDWFLGQARRYLRDRRQTELFQAVAEVEGAYGPPEKDVE